MPETKQSRFPQLGPGEMTEDQKRLISDYASWGRISSDAGASFKVGGGLNMLLRSPELAARLSKVMEYFRKGTALAPRLNEFAILIVSREWTTQYQWQSHYALALREGIPEATLNALAHCKRPAGMQADEAIVYDFIMELQRTRGMSEETFQKAKAALGERQLVDLVGVCGYYTLAAQMHRVADVAPKDEANGMLPELPAQGGTW